MPAFVGKIAKVLEFYPHEGGDLCTNLPRFQPPDLARLSAPHCQEDPPPAELFGTARRLSRLLDNPAIRVSEEYPPVAREWLESQLRHLGGIPLILVHLLPIARENFPAQIGTCSHDTRWRDL